MTKEIGLKRLLGCFLNSEPEKKEQMDDEPVRDD